MCVCVCVEDARLLFYPLFYRVLFSFFFFFFTMGVLFVAIAIRSRMLTTALKRSWPVGKGEG